MEPKDQLIHDICVLQERMDFLYNYHPSKIDEIEKIKKRQRKAVDTYLDEVRPRLTFDDKPCFDGKKTNFAELDEEGNFPSLDTPIARFMPDHERKTGSKSVDR